jgi:hypothetical protein
VKGAAAPVVTLVRERAGEVVHEPRSFRRGDRFKVLLTCAVPEPVTVQVVVLQGGEAFRPLAPAEIRCGNRVALPGAFGLTGAEPAQICVGTACAALAPEPWL